MDFWVASLFVHTRQLVGLARAAEELGFTGVAVSDHVAIPQGFRSAHPSGGPPPFDHTAVFPDALTSIAAMATATRRLRFMTYVYVLPMRDPFSVAKLAGTVALLADDRFALGVGAGWLYEEMALLGGGAGKRGARLDEMLALVRRFLDDGIAEAHGAVFEFGPTGIFPKPERRVPIWVGGKSPAALARAAAYDGWLGMDYPMEEIRRLLPELARARARRPDYAMREAEPFEIIVIPLAGQNAASYAELAALGVTGTVCAPWPLGDPEYASLAPKVAAMREFAQRFITANQRRS
jgi:probable F420-dependent oxidoreductase